MRSTGQATTSLGNVITNLQVHCQFVLDNMDKIKMMFFLGDDMIMLFISQPNTKDLRKNIATYFNMQSKD